MAINIDRVLRVSSPEESKNIEGNFLNREIRLFPKKLSNKQKEHFYSELGLLVKADIDLQTSLEIIVDEVSSNYEKELLGSIKNKVINGLQLSEAMHDSKQFSNYEIQSLRIGEESGSIKETLEELCRYYSARLRQKRQLITALSYPIVVLFTSFGAVFFMLKYVVPMFSDVFKRFKSDLPPLTKLIIKLSKFSSDYFLILVLIIISLIGLIYKERKKSWFKKHASLVLLKTPIIGALLRNIYLAQFCSSMALLLRSKTPLVTSLGLVKDMITFHPLTSSLIEIEKNVIKGFSLYQTMQPYSIYDKKMISLIKVAEEVNKMDIIFDKMAKQYEEEVNNQTMVLGSLLEPLLIIFLGIMVAVILIAMYLPLFKLSTSFGL